MVEALQIFALLLVSVAMALSLAHALELPGKLRLGKAAYTTVQPIYYPGFTFGGLIGEVGGMIALLVVLFLLPKGTAQFWWTLAAFVFLLAVHATYWLVTHPVNNFWVKDVKMAGLGARFFSVHSSNAGGDWMRLRDVWEFSHVVRACLAMLSLISAAVALIA